MVTTYLIFQFFWKYFMNKNYKFSNVPFSVFSCYHFRQNIPPTPLFSNRLNLLRDRYKVYILVFVCLSSENTSNLLHLHQTFDIEAWFSAPINHDKVPPGVRTWRFERLRLLQDENRYLDVGKDDVILEIYVLLKCVSARYYILELHFVLMYFFFVRSDFIA